MDLLEFRACPERDPDGAKLGGLLQAALDAEGLTRRRRLFTGLVAVFSVPVWALAVWPHILPTLDRRLILVGFAALLFGAGMAIAREWRAQLVLDRVMADNPCLVKNPRPGEDRMEGDRE